MVVVVVVVIVVVIVVIVCCHCTCFNSRSTVTYGNLTAIKVDMSCGTLARWATCHLFWPVVLNSLCGPQFLAPRVGCCCWLFVVVIVVVVAVVVIVIVIVVIIVIVIVIVACYCSCWVLLPSIFASSKNSRKCLLQRSSSFKYSSRDILVMR